MTISMAILFLPSGGVLPVLPFLSKATNIGTGLGRKGQNDLGYRDGKVDSFFLFFKGRFLFRLSFSSSVAWSMRSRPPKCGLSKQGQKKKTGAWELFLVVHAFLVSVSSFFFTLLFSPASKASELFFGLRCLSAGYRTKDFDGGGPTRPIIPLMRLRE